MMFLRLADISLKGVRLLKSSSYLIQTATITSRSTRGECLKLKEPFPYEEKVYRWYHEIFDPTILRLSDDNSKVIVVEGSIGAGKTAFCETLAEELEMKYFPQPTMDDLYVLHSGYDLRQHDDEVPEEARTYDHKNFCVNPFTFKAAIFQCRMFQLRFYQYMNALCHLLNTGQGVVLERSYFSDYVFMKAMEENKFVSSEYLKAYQTIYNNLELTYPQPHLIIYLDMPVPVIQERIKTRNYSYEQNSPALTPEYLASLEKFMKQDYLKVARANSEILVYDWSDGGNIDVVIDDVENINFEVVRADRRFHMWRITRRDLYILRKTLINDVHFFDSHFYYPWYNFEEVHNALIKGYMWYDVKAKIPECKFERGYNYLTGDSIFSILFSTDRKRLRERRHYLIYGTGNED